VPLVLENLDDLKEYIEAYAACPIFYRRDGANFTIMAGKAAWEGAVKSGDEADKLEAFLIGRGARKVKCFKDIETLFG
jgi:tagatose-1,6-bisphosphate aldolase